MNFNQIICSLYLEISTYIFTKLTCLPRSVANTYVLIMLQQLFSMHLQVSGGVVVTIRSDVLCYAVDFTPLL